MSIKYPHPNSKALSEQWKRLSDEEKGHYYREQDQLKELHKLQHPDYKYSPKMVSRPSSQPPPAPAPAPSPPPIMPNQPPEDPEPNQPPAIQVLLVLFDVCFNSFPLTGAAASVSATKPINHLVEAAALLESSSTRSYPSANLYKTKPWTKCT